MSASARHESMYGPVASSWEGKGGRFVLSVEVPPNATATVVLPPRAGLDGATEGGRPLEQGNGIMAVKADRDYRAITLGSGTYHFEFPWR